MGGPGERSALCLALTPGIILWPGRHAIAILFMRFYHALSIHSPYIRYALGILLLWRLTYPMSSLQEKSIQKFKEYK
jgi:hypothetical protein